MLLQGGELAWFYQVRVTFYLHNVVTGWRVGLILYHVIVTFYEEVEQKSQLVCRAKEPIGLEAFGECLY